MKLQEGLIGRGISLISPEEIKAIETIWIYEGDNITSINDVLNTDRKITLNKNGFDVADKLSEICNNYDVSPDLIERLLIVEKDFSTLSRRTGIYDRLEKVIEEEAIT